MPNLITAIDKRRQVAECNESCYNATGTACNCICRGRFHGVGLKNALHELRHHRDQILEELAPDYDDILLPFRSKQLWLLPLDSEPSSDST